MTKFALSRHRFTGTTTNALTKSIIDYLTSKGALAWRNNTGAYKPDDKRFIRYGTRGSGDIFAVYRGKFYSIEVKTGSDWVRDSQDEWMDKVEAAGGIAVIARSLQDVIDALEE